MTSQKKPSQQNTKALVASIFPALLMEKGYGDITVQDILKRAKIGRTTFYAYFNSKEDVLKSSINNLRDSLILCVSQDAPKQQSATRLAFSFYFFQHIISHHRIYDDMVGREDFFILECYFRRMLTELVTMDLAITPSSPAQQIKLELIIQHIVGALWSTSIWWLERKQFSAEEVNEYFIKMALPGLEQSLKTL